MPGLVPEILDAVCLLGAAAWPVLGLVVGLLVLRLRYERSRRAAVGRELRERESRYRAIFETAVDATRAARLRSSGYAVHTQLIPRSITAKNRLLLASPPPEGL